jgi:UDP-glucose 4-epimerase
MAIRALVTGAAGFIGSHVADHCIAMGMDVVATDDLSVGLRENVPHSARWRQGDLADEAFVKSLWSDGPYDYVYHIGAYATQHLSHFNRRKNYLVNVVGSMHLINESIRHDVGCFVFASTVAVYGRVDETMHEGLPFDPDDPYGVSKAAVEMDLKVAKKKFGLNSVCFRPHNVYGERQSMTARDKNVVAVFVNQTLRGEPMSVWGEGKQVRAFSHVDDVAPIIARAPKVKEAYGEAFNVGAETPYTILQLANEVAAACGVPPKIVHLPPRHEIPHAVVDNAKVRRVFGTEPSVGLSEGLRRMVNWARKRNATRETIAEPVELPEKLESARKQAEHPGSGESRRERDPDRTKDFAREGSIARD